MVNPVTTNVLLQVPLHAAEVDTWDVPMNSDFTSLDGYLAGVQTVNAAGASPITLSAPAGTPTPAGGPTQSENAELIFTGLLTGNVQVTLPLPGKMTIANFTTGNFVLSFRAVAAGQVIAIDQGAVQDIVNNGTNVQFRNLPPVGSYLDVCDATVPAWITACTVPPYLNCNGATFSAVTYPYLNGKLGGTTLPDIRGTTRYSLNQGTSRLTSAGSGLDGNTRFATKTTQTQTLLTANLPPYTPSGSVTITGGTIGGDAGNTTNGTGGSTVPLGAVSISATFNGTPAAGQISTPFGIIGTGTVSGITLIRAG